MRAIPTPGMRDRHWEELTRLLGKDMTICADDSFTLSKLIALDLDEQIETVQKQSDVAGKEFAIEQAMDKMEGEWKQVQLQVTAYRETGTFVLKGSDVIQQLLDDHIVMTQSMSFSPFKGPFGARIEEWEKTLTLISDIFEEWLKVQRQWMYLEPIFSSDDIMRQLPNEGKRFAGVDRTWRRLMQQASNETDVIAYSRTPRLLQQLVESNQMLELVQKGLAEYLETKRVAFSRFYFLSNDELLEILSQSKDPRAVQPHLKKCFENIDKLRFEDDLKMTAMKSGEGEEVPFDDGIYPKGGVEFWMYDVLEMMKKTVRRSIIMACEDYGVTPRSEWVLKWPGATLIAGSQIFWTREVDTVLSQEGSAGMPAYYEKLHQQLLSLTNTVSGKITKLQRKSLGALITIDVHQRDVTGAMRDAGVDSVYAFDWISQVRDVPEISPRSRAGTRRDRACTRPRAPRSSGTSSSASRRRAVARRATRSSSRSTASSCTVTSTSATRCASSSRRSPTASTSRSPARCSSTSAARPPAPRAPARPRPPRTSGAGWRSGSS